MTSHLTSLARSFPGSLIKGVQLIAVPGRIIILLGTGLGVATAYLVATEDWPVALGLVLILPALLFLYRYPLFGLMAWLAVAPFLMETPTAAGRAVYWVIHRGLPPLIVGIVVLSAALRANKRRLPRLGRAELAMAGYVIMSLYSIWQDNDNSLATAYLFYDRVFSPMCLYLLIRLSRLDEKDVQRLLPIAFFLVVSQSLIGVLSWVAPQMLPPAWLTKLDERTTGSLVNPSTYTIALVFAGLLLLQAALNRKPGWVRTLYISTFLLHALFVFFSFSRGSWLGALLVILGLILLYRKFMVQLGLALLPVVVIILSGGLLTDQFSWASQRLYSEKSEETALSRLPVFLAAYRMFEAKPFFGWGYGNFDVYDRQFQESVGGLIAPEKDHASHNSYLTLLAEQGLIGSALYLAPVLWWLILTMKARPRMPAAGFGSWKLLMMFWLIILNQLVVNNFHNNRVEFGLGLWWVTLGFIANLVYDHLEPGGLRPSTGLRPPTQISPVATRFGTPLSESAEPAREV